jgi:hypothetical protein
VQLRRQHAILTGNMIDLTAEVAAAEVAAIARQLDQEEAAAAAAAQQKARVLQRRGLEERLVSEWGMGDDGEWGALGDQLGCSTEWGIGR